MTYKQLLTKIKKNKISIDETRLKAVFEYAKKAHQGQLRHNGEKAISHPLKTTGILASWNMPQVVLEAALLHELIKIGKNLEEVKKLFGEEVSKLIEQINKVGVVKLRYSTDKIFIENLRKMFVAMAKDIRVILIRLADRLHNMQTLDAVPLSKQKRIAQETLEVYAPLAERLGMGDLKGKLEDLAFPFTHPEEYKNIIQVIKNYMPQASQITIQMINDIKKILEKNKIDAQVHGRSKHKYSFYKKSIRPGIDKDFSQIHDLVALRVITKNRQDCYAILGLIHSIYKPAPHLGISDFISQPKPNGYQSIHTKIFNHQGQIVEVQIRTEKMHHQAEFGAAAHYAYSEAKGEKSEQELEKGIAFKISQKMSWIEQLANWQQQITQDKESVLDYKLDALSQRIYVFSPKGDVYDLPIESTVIDFAFAVHSDLGFYIQLAKVNQKIASLDHQLKNGDVVEIIKQKTKRKPSRDWVRWVKTAKARQAIKAQFSQKNLS
jgi:GTP diphosphokinase / guanosine-3',5'-bis(diphosphate) 3'-diphosphatase